MQIFCLAYDDRNIRALFERALSALPPVKSVEVWKRFTQFEQTYRDLASMLKVEQRRKEALSGTGEESASALESSLQEVVSRYSFMDLWPRSSNDLDNLVRQEWLSKNINKKNEKITLSNGAAQTDKASSGLATGSNQSTKVIYPDTSRMMVYDPKQKPGTAPEVSNSATLSSLSVPSTVGGTSNSPNDILRAAPPALASFIASLPAMEGPSPDVDFVLSICMQSNFPAKQAGKPGTTSKQMQGVAAPSLSDTNKSHPVPNSSAYKPTRDRQTGKRKDFDRQDDNDTVSVQSQHVFKLCQIRKALATGSQTGSASYGSASAFSGDLSASSG